MYKKTLIITILSLLTSIASYGLDWHDRLVTELTDNPSVDKTIVVERARATHRIEKANYKFEFSTKDYGIAYMIRDALLKHQKNALKLSLEGESILMQVEEVPNISYIYKLSKEKGKYQLLITVGPINQRSKPIALITNDADIQKLIDEIADFKVPSSGPKDFNNALSIDYMGENERKSHKIVGYALDVDSQRVIKLHKISYDPYGCPYEEGDTITVSLKDNGKARMSDVTVVGYGTIKKDSSDGTISSDKSSTFTVKTKRSSGEKEEGDNRNAANYFGVFSNAGTVCPEIYVDGKLSTDKDLAALSPYDIESIDVLKDKEARNLLGTVAKDGVILIRTKRK